MRFSGGALPQISFLDIETEGLKRSSKVLLVGVLFYKGSCFQLFGDFCNQKTILALLQNSKLIVTFNGTFFDLPVLERNFGILINKQRHLDLRMVLKNEKIYGGLKEVEKIFGVKRDLSLDPEEIVASYNSYVVGGSIEGLKTLLRYNYEDLKAMETIFRYLNFRNFLMPL